MASRRLRTVLAIALLALPLATMPLVARPSSAAVVLQPGPGGFVGISPVRVTDTRALGPLRAGEIRRFSVTADAAGWAPRQAGAVALNITAVDPDDGYVSVWPADEPQPGTSVLNFDRGQTIANAVTLRVSDSGEIAVFTSSRTNLIIDVLGWYARPGIAKVGDQFQGVALSGGGFFGIAPTRLLDSRGTQKFAPNEQRAISVRPNTELFGAEIAAAVLNITAVAPDATGYASVVGPGENPASVSNVSFVTQHQAVANQVTTRVGGDGTVIVYASASVHLIVDLMGFYTSGDTTPGGYHPVASTRVMDTRPTVRSGNASLNVLTGTWTLGLTSTAGVPANAAAVTLNLTGVLPSTGGYFQLWPDSTPATPTSALNIGADEIRSNAVTSALGTNGGTQIFTDTDASFLVDVSGWFSSPFVDG